MRSLSLAIVLIACSSPVPIVPAVHPPLLKCSDLSFSPDAGEIEMAAKAVQRWSAATGCKISIRLDSFTQIVSVPSLGGQKGTETCGRSFNNLPYVSNGIMISRDPDCDQKLGIIMHEIGHALGTNEHSEKGIMYAYPTDRMIINSESLKLICKNLDCADFNPEPE